MIVLYLSVLLLLGAIHFLLRRRAVRLERRYARAAGEADELLRQASFREGNSPRPDPYQSAKRQYRLGQAAEKRDAVEVRYTAWQTRAERCGALIARLRRWRGKVLPYAFGLADAALLLVLVERLAPGTTGPIQALAQSVTALLSR
jgi:hypothetical protein